MSDVIPIKLCVLWEGELRQAAKLLQAAFDSTGEDEDRRAEKYRNALLASHTALIGLTDDKVVVMIGSDAIRKRAKGKRK